MNEDHNIDITLLFSRNHSEFESTNASAERFTPDVLGYNNLGLGESPKTALRVLFLSSFCMGGLGIVIGLALNGVESALDAWWALASIFSGGILGLFLLGFISRKIKSRAAAIGIICGILVISWMSLSPILFSGSWIKYSSPFHANLTIVLGTITVLFVGFICSFLLEKKVVGEKN